MARAIASLLLHAVALACGASAGLALLNWLGGWQMGFRLGAGRSGATVVLDRWQEAAMGLAGLAVALGLLWLLRRFSPPA